jgi:hypothetical protein
MLGKHTSAFIPVPVLLLVHDGTRRSKKVANVKLELWNLVVRIFDSL